MSLDTVKEHLKKYNKDKDIIILDKSIATVLEAAQVLNTDSDNIAKTLAFSNNKNGCILIVVSGNSRIDNHKFKQYFGFKAKMLNYEETLYFTSHKIGGVCPFGLSNVENVYLDISLKNHDKVFPACGSSNSAIELSIKELETISGSSKWIDVCKPKDTIN